jgi:uncharacterized protein (DUF2252 family)
MTLALRRTVGSAAELDEAGRALRKRAPRSTLADWSVTTEGRDPVALVRAAEKGRVPALIELRRARMAASPFSFFRGAAAVMAHDLATLPVTGVTHQICGDAHAANFGLYSSPEREIVFDLNDFDESRPGPWEWDIARLAASLVLAARQNGHGAKHQRGVALRAGHAFRGALTEIAAGPIVDPWVRMVRIDEVIGQMPDRKSQRSATAVVAAARKQTSRRAVKRFVRRVDGVAQFRDEPPLVGPVEGSVAARVRAAVNRYLPTLPEHYADAVRGYRIAAVGRKVVGVGSVGLRDYLVLLQGLNADDVLVLQVKEATTSQLDPYLAPVPAEHQGRRVVDGQHRMQAFSDPLLGWTAIAGRDYYVRQFRDVKGTVDLDCISPSELGGYARLCAATLALAHARGGQPALLHAYLGDSDRFDRALAAFALAYADQTQSDHAAFAAAVSPSTA